MASTSPIPTQQTGYVPGSCNIGPDERASRRKMGIFSTIGAIVLLLVLLATNANKPWRLLLFLPVAGAAMGFLQDRMHFCAGYGFKGVLNVLGPVGETEDVMTAEFRKHDKQKALQISALSVAAGVLVTALAMVI